MQANGYMGKMLWVNLDSGELAIKPTPEDDLKRFIGGRGLGIKMLSDLAPQGWIYTHPEIP